MLQRITRAKARVREAGMAFDLPPRRAWPQRRDAVLLARSREEPRLMRPAQWCRFRSTMPACRTARCAGAQSAGMGGAAIPDGGAVAHVCVFERTGQHTEPLSAFDAALALATPRAERLWVERQRAELA